MYAEIPLAEEIPSWRRPQGQPGGIYKEGHAAGNHLFSCFILMLVAMLNYDYYPRTSLHAYHGAACSKDRMTKRLQFLGRHALASVPHHKQP
jgi:hypothetical protein